MVAPSMTRAAALASGVAVALETNGTVREARGLASSTYRVSPASANWMLSRPRTPTPRAIASVEVADPVDHLVAQGDRRQRAGRVAGVDAGLLDVLHHPAQVELGAVVERVDVDLDRVVEEPVDQHRVGRGDLGGPLDVGGQGALVVDDLHAPPAEHVATGGPAPGSRSRRRSPGPRRRTGHAVLGRRQAGLGQHLAERAPFLGQVDGLRRRCRRSARRRPSAPGRASAGSGRRAGRSPRPPGRPAARRGTTSSTSSRVSGSK